MLKDAIADGGDCAVVVASQGHYDESALEAVLASGAPYVGPRRLAHARRHPARRVGSGRSADLERLRYPAGLDLGGRSPEEVALSILAEIVRLGAPASPPSAGHGPGCSPHPTRRRGRPQGTAVDPVCHMEVAIAGATHVADVDDTTYYFCCGGCRARFLKDPQRYLAPTP